MCVLPRRSTQLTDPGIATCRSNRAGYGSTLSIDLNLVALDMSNPRSRSRRKSIEPPPSFAAALGCWVIGDWGTPDTEPTPINTNQNHRKDSGRRQAAVQGGKGAWASIESGKYRSSIRPTRQERRVKGDTRLDSDQATKQYDGDAPAAAGGGMLRAGRHGIGVGGTAWGERR